MSLLSSRKGGQTYRDKHKKLGLCTKCNRKAEPGKVDCVKHGNPKRKGHKPKWKYQKI